jgi:hypothetical protein
LCGEKLCDSHGVMMAMNPDGSSPQFATWEVGRLVKVTHGNPTVYRLLDDTDGKLPTDTCFDLLDND